jgi:transcriptional regulator with XRE-family HTH domain
LTVRSDPVTLPEPMTTFSPQRLRNARINAGLTQAELARALQVTERNVGRWERGNNAPHAGTVGRLADVLEVSIQDLYDRDEQAVA